MKRARKVLVAPTEPLISHSYEERETRDHAYTGGGDLASPPCLYRRSHFRCRKRRYQPNLWMAEGHRFRAAHLSGLLSVSLSRRLHRVLPVLAGVFCDAWTT